MRILFVVPYVPNLIRSRPHNLIRSLAARGNEITVMTLWSNEEEKQSAASIRDYCKDLHLYHLERWRSLRNCLVALPTKQPLQAWFCWQPTLAREMTALVDPPGRDIPFDVVHVEHLRGVKFALHLRDYWQRKSGGRVTPPIIWDSVDSISLLFRQSSAQSRRRLYRWLTQFELARTEPFEAKMLGQFARTLVTSEKDRAAFLAHPDSYPNADRLTVLTNGVDLDYFHPDGAFQPGAKDIVVSGKMSYHANVTMVMYLVEKIMPLIWAQCPDARLWIAGKDPHPSIQAFASHPNITVTGTVDDIRPYLHKAALAVAPVVYGAGIQNKVLESMACGTPVVATPLAVSAIQAEPGKEILTAAEPNEFAGKVLNLLQEPALRYAIGIAGRSYVERNHDWGRIASSLEGIYHGDI